MRSLVWLALTAAVISFGAPAQAAVLNLCTAGCTTDSTGSLQVDYTVPADGQTYEWDLWSDPSHPTALITLDAPNDTSVTEHISNGDGTTTADFLFTSPDFSWNEVVTPGHTVITVSDPANFNFCASNPPAGTACSVNNLVGGDGTFLHVNVDAPVTITFDSIAIPEPATWSLLIGGFGLLGWALRRRRSTVLA